MKSRPARIIRTPSVLILKGKHTSTYFYVTSDTKLFAAALSIVTSRYDLGYWYRRPFPTDSVDVTDAEIEKLPVFLQESARDHHKRYIAERTAYENALAEWDLLMSAIRKRSGRLAWEVLKSRRDYEYEDFQIVPCEIL